MSYNNGDPGLEYSDDPMASVWAAIDRADAVAQVRHHLANAKASLALAAKEAASEHGVLSRGLSRDDIYVMLCEALDDVVHDYMDLRGAV